jgi:hypothetical protein
MELGVFIVLIGIASIGFVRKSYLFLGLGIALFLLLAILFFAKVDIVQTKEVKILAGTNSTSVTNPDNSTSTTTQNNYIDGTEETPIINQYHNEIGWLMMLFAFAQIFLLITRIFSGFRWY